MWRGYKRDARSPAQEELHHGLPSLPVRRMGLYGVPARSIYISIYIAAL
ncbi:Portion glycyl-tRNA synthetase alpha chain [Acetobacter pomorum]|nr:Portion glycyl-tRNA synthetase alpha chain [Acetobacter pomorum]